ncbi:MAG: leucyl aminopeptidase [Rickettsiales bacterium]|nr:leucyl aminopeptidase [Rickettsiales bacterium]
MQVEVGSTQASNLSTDILVFAVHGKGGRRSPAFSALNRAIGGGLSTLLEIQGWKGRAGQLVSFPAPSGVKARWVAVGSLGERGRRSPESLRTLATQVGSLARTSGLERVGLYLDSNMDKRESLDRASAQALGEGLQYGGYRFDQHKANKDGNQGVTSTYLYHEGRRDRPLLAAAIERGAVIAEAQSITRDLVNEPGNIINPESLVEFARDLAKARGLDITVFDKEACEEAGMGAFLAVGQGSATRPALVHLSYTPKQKARRKVALVGKAVTFDAGGLCLKPPGGQATMKMDMGGSAAVIGAIAAAADLELDVEVHAIFPAVENLLGAAAYRTGDVITASSGKTIEVLNTDAEGRLTLADALIYACKQKPDVVVDLATLTGACVVALGPSVGGIMGTGRGLIRDLRAAGDSAGEMLWELPMPEEYREHLNSKIADIKNVGGRWGGAITAGIFLKEFVDPDIPWAHIDIAGPCFTDKPRSGHQYGGTGFPVRALVEWLSN